MAALATVDFVQYSTVCSPVNGTKHVAVVVFVFVAVVVYAELENVTFIHCR